MTVNLWFVRRCKKVLEKNKAPRASSAWTLGGSTARLTLRAQNAPEEEEGDDGAKAAKQSLVKSRKAVSVRSVEAAACSPAPSGPRRG